MSEGSAGNDGNPVERCGVKLLALEMAHSIQVQPRQPKPFDLGKLVWTSLPQFPPLFGEV